jgi:hypothetical protein
LWARVSTDEQESGNQLAALRAEDAIARNIVTWRTMRWLTQKSLAARMSALGFGWRQQFAASAERGQRRVTASEVLGLALALETTMSSLLTPAAPFTRPAERWYCRRAMS